MEGVTGAERPYRTGCGASAVALDGELPGKTSIRNFPETSEFSRSGKAVGSGQDQGRH